MKFPNCALKVSSLMAVILADCQDFNAEPCDSERKFLNIKDKSFPYYVKSGNPRIEYLKKHNFTEFLLIQHGGASDAGNYFCILQNSLNLEFCGNPLTSCPEAEKFYVFAPEFTKINDASSVEYFYWDGGWKEAGYDTSETISSFEVFDKIVELASGVEKIKFSGHSAGAQTMARYSIGGNYREYSEDIKFYAANPSSAPYFSNSRPEIKFSEFCDNNSTINEKPITFTGNPQISTCAEYNNWPYGLSNLNDYFTNTNQNINFITSNYKPEKLQLISSNADNCCSCEVDCCDCEDTNGLDTSCGANFQGKCRLERVHAYSRHLENEFQEREINGVIDLKNVEHDGCVVFRHDLVRKCLFRDGCDNSSTQGTVELMESLIYWTVVIFLLNELNK